MAIDPEDPRVIYISSNAADPFALGDIDSVPLAAGERYEIWRGFTADGGLTFAWTPVTENSPADNLRPIVPENHDRTRHLLWFYGSAYDLSLGSRPWEARGIGKCTGLDDPTGVPRTEAVGTWFTEDRDGKRLFVPAGN